MIFYVEQWIFLLCVEARDSGPEFLVGFRLVGWFTWNSEIKLDTSLQPSTRMVEWNMTYQYHSISLKAPTRQEILDGSAGQGTQNRTLHRLWPVGQRLTRELDRTCYREQQEEHAPIVAIESNLFKILLGLNHQILFGRSAIITGTCAFF